MGFRGVEERGYWGGQDLILITLDRHECFSVFHHLQKDKERKQRHSLKLDKKRRESSKRNYYIICPRVLIKAIIIISCARSRGKIFSCVSKLFSSQLCQVSRQDFSCVSKLFSSQLCQVSRQDENQNIYFDTALFDPCTQHDLFYWFTKIRWVNMNMIQHETHFVLWIKQKTLSR